MNVCFYSHLQSDIPPTAVQSLIIQPSNPVVYCNFATSGWNDNIIDKQLTATSST